MSDNVDIPQSKLPETPVVKAVPPFIKWGLFIFTSLVILIAVYVVAPGSSVDDVENASTPSTLSDSLDIAPVPSDIVQRSELPTSTVPVVPNNPSLALEEVRTSINSLEERILNIENTLSTALTDISPSMTASNKLDGDVQRLSSELKEISTVLDGLVSIVDDLNVRFAAQDEQVSKLARRIKRSRKTAGSKQIMPAFSLLSIDRWGDRDSAVINLNGQLTTASVGDTLAGWTLLTIRRPGCIDVERDRDRISASVCIAKGGS